MKKDPDLAIKKRSKILQAQLIEILADLFSSGLTVSSLKKEH